MLFFMIHFIFIFEICEMNLIFEYQTSLPTESMSKKKNRAAGRLARQEAFIDQVATRVAQKLRLSDVATVRQAFLASLEGSYAQASIAPEIPEPSAFEDHPDGFSTPFE